MGKSPKGSRFEGPVGGFYNILASLFGNTSKIPQEITEVFIRKLGLVFSKFP
jgi:hypothetical protein